MRSGAVLSLSVPCVVAELDPTIPALAGHHNSHDSSLLSGRYNLDGSLKYTAFVEGVNFIQAIDRLSGPESPPYPSWHVIHLGHATFSHILPLLPSSWLLARPSIP